MGDRVQNQPPEVLYKESCSSIFHNILRKIPELKSLFNKAAGLEVCNFIKKRRQLRCFSLNIAKFLRTAIRKNICERLLLRVPLHVTILFLLPLITSKMRASGILSGCTKRQMAQNGFIRHGIKTKQHLFASLLIRL